MKIIDSHAHLMDEMFKEDFENVVSRCIENNLEYVINIGYSEETSYKAVEMAQKYDFMYATIGLHPDECNVEIVNLEFIKNILNNKADNSFINIHERPKVVAIGEIGLDYHYDSTNKENQIKHFIKQIKLANELSFPVAIHSRDADMDMLKILKENKIEEGFVMHCFSSSTEVAKEILKLGGYISLAGTVTFKNAKNLLEVAKIVPEDKLLIETDCPYLTPEPFRGKRNEPSYIWNTAEKIAEIRGISLEKICETTNNNVKRFYRI